MTGRVYVTDWKTAATVVVAGTATTWVADTTLSGDLVADDGNYARSTLIELASSRHIRPTNFGFAVPETARTSIVGAQLEVTRQASDADSIVDLAIRLVVDNSLSGDDLQDVSQNWPTTDGVAVYGYPLQSWNTSPTVAQVNASGFGFSIRAENQNTLSTREARVGRVRGRVFYRLPQSAQVRVL